MQRRRFLRAIGACSGMLSLAGCAQMLPGGSVEILRELHVRPVIRRDEAPPEVADSPVY